MLRKIRKGHARHLKGLRAGDWDCGGERIVSKRLKVENFVESSNACLRNAERLISDIEFLEIDSHPSAYALAIIAQEEIAKAFLLYLIYCEVIPWNKFVKRSLRDHSCKQLWRIVLNELAPTTEKFLEKAQNGTLANLDIFIDDVADVLNIYRHEKVRRWEDSRWFWDEPPKYRKQTRKVAEGHVDKIKQNALYVQIGEDGRVCSMPSSITQQLMDGAVDAAKRFHSLVKRLIEKEYEPVHFDWLKQALKEMFKGNQ